jgi:hypothetical protein
LSLIRAVKFYDKWEGISGKRLDVLRGYDLDQILKRRNALSHNSSSASESDAILAYGTAEILSGRILGRPLVV